ncbi:MAG: hypothetical protein ACKVQK_29870 [Burkholderiales bacterium]
MNAPVERQSSGEEPHGTDDIPALTPSIPVKPLSARIGIFRRVAVERYMQPFEFTTPEMLAPLGGQILLAGIALLATAMALLGFY